VTEAAVKSRWLLPIVLVVLLASGCSRSGGSVLRPGDVVRPEVAFAPRAPWPAGARAVLGLLLLVERPGVEARYLRDEEVNLDQAVLLARVTFLNGERLLGNPLEVPFVRDC
jgi:hypothetical protein